MGASANASSTVPCGQRHSTRGDEGIINASTVQLVDLVLKKCDAARSPESKERVCSSVTKILGFGSIIAQ